MAQLYWAKVAGKGRLLFLFLALATLTVSFPASAQQGVSRPGEYEGYSQPIYDEWVRTSEYVTVRDGRRLAADIFRPAVDGEPVEEPLPVVWTHHRYHRAQRAGGMLITVLDQMPWLRSLLEHGYVVAAVDARGTGASYGVWDAPFSPDENLDAYDVTEWLAAQPWSSGDIGMYGQSYGGIAQYMAASTAPPHLKAIFPEMALFDLYSFAYSGGVFRDDFATQWGRLLARLDVSSAVAPVDEDGDGTMLAEAIEEHEANLNVYDVFSALPYRDSQIEGSDPNPYLTYSPSSYTDEIRDSGVAVYHLSGWYDVWPRDAFAWFSNLDNPQKIIVGPWSHSDRLGFDVAAEHLRWYDYWLKGIDNGVMDEEPIHYFVMGAPEGEEWQSAQEWPLPHEVPAFYYLLGGPSGSIESENDGALDTAPPTGTAGADSYVVDYSTSSGMATRWTDASGGSFGYPDMTSNDKKGLTFTTPPLPAAVEVTGHPVVHLWVTATSPDVDFFVYLEEVSESGYSFYVTEGTLRASHRAISEPPFQYLGLAYHPSGAQDVADLPAEPAEIVVDLLPTSNVFDAGNRIRVTITCADRDNALTPEIDPPPVVSVHRTADHASHVVLPVIPPAPEAEAAEGTEGAEGTQGADSADSADSAETESTSPTWLVVTVCCVIAAAVAAAVVVSRHAAKRDEKSKGAEGQ